VTTRGSCHLEIDEGGGLVDNVQNLEKLKALFRDGTLEALPFSKDRQRYFMFQRRIDRWSSAAAVRRDLDI
jgi:hypothetical protein